jgi:para-aminobenzoate synthetase
MRVLIIDNYDSFTYNLYQMVSRLTGVAAHVVRNNEVDYAAVAGFDADAIILSPGPGRPECPADLGVALNVLAHDRRPILGVCLGHQALGWLAGGKIVPAPEPMHGRLSPIFHRGQGIFAGLPSPFRATRYHSLMLAGLPAEFSRDAWTPDGLIMAISDRAKLRFGVQFHPESFATERGAQIMTNFLQASGMSRVSGAAPPAPAPRRVQGGVPIARTYTLHYRKRKTWIDPEAVFAKVFGDAIAAFWLDGDCQQTSPRRFSYMGDGNGPMAETLSYRAHGRSLRIERPGSIKNRPIGIFDYVQSRVRDGVGRAAAGDYDGAFAGGFVGYFGYELKSECGARIQEGVAAHPSDLPDAALIFADRFLAFDHDRAEVWACALGDGDDAAGWFDGIEATLDALGRAGVDATPPVPPSHGSLQFSARHDRDRYLQKIATAMTAIRAGESYEICLTNRMEAPVSVDPLRLYRTLRRRNPAPCAAYFRFGEFAVACSSPELFLKIDADGAIHSHPIKGTAPRGQNPLSDQAARARLGSSEKDIAENLMIVDLVRNDLGRVCEIGSVTVPDFARVESFATVHQLVSHVEGRLRPGLDAIDALRAAFPGGSMTGAPKVRTMAILDELEGAPRGVYSGTLGFVSLSGAATLGMVIRTLVVEKEKISLGSGGAITALSDPQAEWNEVILKAEVLMRAAAEAATGDADAFALVSAQAPDAPPGNVRLRSSGS